jgi:hypothetical protein
MSNYDQALIMLMIPAVLLIVGTGIALWREKHHR